MAVHRDPKSLLQAQTKRFARVLADMEIEHEKLVSEMKYEAVELTSGTVSTATLRRLGHPFARRPSGRKRGRLKALPINKQSGRLRAGFRRVRVPAIGGKISYDLTNKVPYAKYVLSLGGTTKMISRGFW